MRTATKQQRERACAVDVFSKKGRSNGAIKLLKNCTQTIKVNQSTESTKRLSLESLYL